MLILTLTLILACAGIALHAGRLPGQNLFAISILTVALAAAFEGCALYWNIPYAPLQNPVVTFWIFPIAWLGILLIARRVSQQLFRSQRAHPNYGLFVFGATALLITGAWAIAAARVGQLTLLAVVGHLIAAVIILLAIFPWMIVKRPVRGRL